MQSILMIRQLLRGFTNARKDDQLAWAAFHKLRKLKPALFPSFITTFHCFSLMTTWVHISQLSLSVMDLFSSLYLLLATHCNTDHSLDKLFTGVSLYHSPLLTPLSILKPALGHSPVSTLYPHLLLRSLSHLCHERKSVPDL